MSKREEVDIIIREAGSHPVTAESIVERARDAARFPELNRHIWKVPEAELAAEARLARAHKLLISIRIVSEEGTVTRMMMHTKGTKGYRPTEMIVSTPNLATIKLRELAADIGRARSRLAAFRAFLPIDIADDIDAALRLAEERATPVPAIQAAAS